MEVGRESKCKVARNAKRSRATLSGGQQQQEVRVEERGGWWYDVEE